MQPVVKKHARYAGGARDSECERTLRERVLPVAFSSGEGPGVGITRTTNQYGAGEVSLRVFTVWSVPSPFSVSTAHHRPLPPLGTTMVRISVLPR